MRAPENENITNNKIRFTKWYSKCTSSNQRSCSEVNFSLQSNLLGQGNILKLIDLEVSVHVCAYARRLLLALRPHTIAKDINSRAPGDYARMF